MYYLFVTSMTQPKTVFVGLSGGVDSAVSAALLQEQGYNVVGAFIKIWSPEFIECTWKEDRLDAMRVCVALGIPFREVDLSEEYKREVVGDMIAKYRAGATPNPDVLCNRVIKFGAFARWAFAQGADLIATGHYARIGCASQTCTQGGGGGGEMEMFSLLTGLDRGKDQSYFLYRMTQDDLRRTLFPIGAYEKKDVRALAQKFDLPVARKPDSQGLCFVGDVSLPEFLGRFIPLVRGPVVNERNETIGEHDGAALYTLGQRHGIHAPNGPYFVTRIDVVENIVHVSSRADDALTREAMLHDMHWVGDVPRLPLQIEALTRYRAPRASVTLARDGEDIRATFDEPQLLSPGQSLVLYAGEQCLGGGVI